MEDIKPNEKIGKAAIEGWTKEEKFHLLTALKANESSDIETIRDYIPSKNDEEIRLAIQYYKSIALQHPLFKQKQEEVKKNAGKPRVPLTSWAKKLTDNLSFNELHTETSNALRLIADLENIPSPACTENIDFRQVYHQIANAMEGKPVVPDLATTAILSKCVTETALSSKAFLKTSAYKYVINTIDLADKEINSFPRSTEDQELAMIRHLASQRSYNPFMVPEEYLKPSCDTTWSTSTANTNE